MGPSGRKARGCSRHGRPYHIDWSTKNRLKIYFSGCFSYCLNGSPVDRIELLHKACNFRLYSSLLSKKRAELASYSSGFFRLKILLGLKRVARYGWRPKYSVHGTVFAPRGDKNNLRGREHSRVRSRFTASHVARARPRTTAPLPTE